MTNKSSFSYLMIAISTAAILIIILLISAKPSAAAATTYFVKAAGGNDGNDCLSQQTACATIGNAIAKAADGDVVNISAGMYFENITINKHITLIGAGVDKTIVDGSQTGRVFYVFDNLRNLNVKISHMTIQNGGGVDLGGGIYNFREQLTVDSVRIYDNHASEIGGGGGIASYGNRGTNGAITITNSTIEANLSLNGSAALYTFQSGLMMENVAVFDNMTSDGANSAEAIILQGNNGRPMNIVNTTIARNDAGLRLISFATVSVTNSTIAQNSGIGVNNASGALHSLNNLLADNDIENSGNNCTGTPITSHGYNLEDSNSCTFDEPTDIIDTDPHISPLDDNGGPSLTIAIAQNSPAVDMADADQCPATDQRQFPRPYDGDLITGAICDIGAFEWQPIFYSIWLPQALTSAEAN